MASVASLLPSLTDWPNANVLPKGSHLQEGVDALRKLSEADGYLLERDLRTLVNDWRLAQVVTAGPNGEADTQDERYWLQLLAISDADPTDTLQVVNDDSIDPSIIPATNISEWLTGSHGLVQGTVVLVRGKLDLGTPQQTHWLFQALGNDLFIGNVEQTGGSDGNDTTAASWTYTVRRLGIVVGTGIGQAKPRPAGRMQPQAGSSGYALCFYGSDGSVNIWDAGEIPRTKPACT